MAKDKYKRYKEQSELYHKGFVTLGISNGIHPFVTKHHKQNIVVSNRELISCPQEIVDVYQHCQEHKI